MAPSFPEVPQDADLPEEVSRMKKKNPRARKFLRKQGGQLSFIPQQNRDPSVPLKKKRTQLSATEDVADDDSKESSSEYDTEPDSDSEGPDESQASANSVIPTSPIGPTLEPSDGPKLTVATALPASTSPALATVTGPTLIDTTAVPVSPSPILETDESFESGFIDFEWEFKSKDLDNEFAKKMGEKGEPMEKEPFEWDPVDPLGLLDPLDSPVKDIRKDLDKY